MADAVSRCPDLLLPILLGHQNRGGRERGLDLDVVALTALLLWLLHPTPLGAFDLLLSVSRLSPATVRAIRQDAGPTSLHVFAFLQRCRFSVESACMQRRQQQRL